MSEVQVKIYENFELEVTTWKEVTEHCEKIAQEIATVARATAPRDSGAYAASIEVERFKSGARVISKVPYAGQIEFGPADGSKLGKWIFYLAASSLGLKFRKKRGG